MTFTGGQLGQLAFLNNINDPWSTYSPTLGGFTLTSATYRYKQVGKMVDVAVNGVIGVTSTSFIVPLPAATVAVSNQLVGHAVAIKVSTNTYYTAAALVSTSTQVYFASHAATGPWGPSLPFTWVPGDPFSCVLRYEAS